MIPQINLLRLLQIRRNIARLIQLLARPAVPKIREPIPASRRVRPLPILPPGRPPCKGRVCCTPGPQAVDPGPRAPTVGPAAAFLRKNSAREEGIGEFGEVVRCVGGWLRRADIL
jgi:hypothetical protein